ncbi:MAG TPA: chemotaxis response regulator protein-glutamate methylesterase [Verrucomicrobiae bacterium]|nr:chemotaxis response regulator protein-glutamate methylesterase [Verrucomicrobiae bacterium]
MNALRKIRVLVVDDSAVVRRAISDALAKDPEIEVVGSACDPYIARDKILELNPDVLTLDIEMPRMDGITFLKILQQHRPMPVVVISSLTQAGSRSALAALEAGAVDVLAKPSSSWSIGDLADQLAHRVKGAAKARMSSAPNPIETIAKASSTGSSNAFNPRQIVVLGASTGGTEAIKSVLTRLPNGLPGICVVQHIPAVFSKAFAERLNECCAMEVREAAHGDEVKPGRVLIAPGDFHMALEWDGRRYLVRLHQGPPLHFTRPAVDVLFNSAAACAGANALGVVLTGMGSDGAQGMKKLKEAGAITLAQNEATCVVYGMPRAAVELRVVDHVLPLEAIPGAILKALENQLTRNASRTKAGATAAV